jgi:hypothetical protein
MARKVRTGTAMISLILGSCGGLQEDTERQLRAVEAGTLLPLASLFPRTVETVCLRRSNESLAQQPLAKAEDAPDEGSLAFVITSKDGKRSHALHRRSAALDVLTASELHGERPLVRGLLWSNPVSPGRHAAPQDSSGRGTILHPYTAQRVSGAASATGRKRSICFSGVGRWKRTLARRAATSRFRNIPDFPHHGMCRCVSACCSYPTSLIQLSL